MLRINILPIIKERGIERPYTILKKEGLSHHIAIDLLNGNPRNFRLDTIEALCKLFVCEPTDLLEWTPTGKHQFPADHPIHKLAKKESAVSWKETVANLPLSELRELTRNIMSKANANNSGS